MIENLVDASAFQLAALSHFATERVWRHVPLAQGVLGLQAALSLLAIVWRWRTGVVVIGSALVAAISSLAFFNPITGFEARVPQISVLILVFAPGVLAVAISICALCQVSSSSLRTAALVIAAALFVSNVFLVPGMIEAAN